MVSHRLDRDWNRRSKNDQSDQSKEGRGGARPYIGGNPPSGPAGAGRVGLSPVGVSWMLFGTKKIKVSYDPNTLLCKTPLFDRLGRSKGDVLGGRVLGSYQTFIFFVPRATIPNG